MNILCLILSQRGLQYDSANDVCQAAVIFVKIDAG